VTTAAVGDAYFQFIQGRTLEGKGDVAGAIAAYRKAIDLMPQASDVRAELAGLYAREGRAAEAISEAEGALKTDPDNREAHRILGFVRSALADNAASAAQQATLVTQAVGHFEKALAGGTRDPGVELSLGRLYVRLGQHPKAIQTLQAFLNDQPGYPEGVLLLVESLEATGQFAPAVIALEPLVRSEPDMVRARVWLAEMYERVGRAGDAIPHWAELAKTNPSNVAIRSRYATALVNSGRLDDGRQVLLGLTSDAPRDISAWYLLSQVENRAGRADAADAAARKISEIDPADPRGPLALAEARSARQDYRGAVATLEPVLAALRNQPAGGAYSRVALELADALEKSEDRAKAIRVLEDALTRDAADIDILQALGWAQVQHGRLEDGRAALTRAAAARPTSSLVLHHLAESLFQLKRYREAMETWNRALAGDRDGIDVEEVTRRRDRAKELVGK
jgi:tetratricopeptide (TPR) repeat protein